ncbi:hypothetical protein EfmE745_03159 (plasmid) [Enterococcus faecium]|nr:hypothetical protein EfmE745_03159 [Enterococcus faecium]
MSKKKGARQRFKKRKSYLRWLGIFMIIGFLILASPIYTHKKVDIPDEGKHERIFKHEGTDDGFKRKRSEPAISF